jgi:hypothetical protein
MENMTRQEDGHAVAADVDRDGGQGGTAGHIDDGTDTTDAARRSASFGGLRIRPECETGFHETKRAC